VTERITIEDIKKMRDLKNDYTLFGNEYIQIRKDHWINLMWSFKRMENEIKKLKKAKHEN